VKTKPTPDLLLAFVQSINHLCKGMRPGILETGHVSMVMDTAKTGNLVVWFDGLGAPLVLREVEKDVFTILGPAYILGEMEGEFIGRSPPSKNFTLI
jgi:hypothetical protein